jgi:hypothetical protein
MRFAGESSDDGISALSAELHDLAMMAGFEPATSRFTGEVTVVFCTGECLRNSYTLPRRSFHHRDHVILVIVSEYGANSSVSG